LKIDDVVDKWTIGIKKWPILLKISEGSFKIGACIGRFFILFCGINAFS
jgi:hypothetical protein